MRKLLSTLALAALLAGAATSAHARVGWYGRADVGVTVGGEAEIPFNSYYDEGKDAESASYQSEWNVFSGVTADFEDGWMVDAGAGYEWGNGLRAEVELARRTDEVSVERAYGYAPSVESSEYGYLDSDNNVIATSVMLNGFYDFNRDGSFRPYVGVGVGYANVAVGEPDDSNWAWQAMAGVAIPVNDRMTVDIGYRHFNVDDLDYTSRKSDYTHEAVTLGLRYQFAAPAAPPAPPAPPPPPPPPLPPPVICPTSQFVVYFEWDRSNLNAEAMATIDQAVARARECNLSAVAIVGHTDTSGPNVYNMGLSERRALVVRDALATRGISMASIAMQARGETELARATRDGVREPLNRRTAVTISFR